MKQRVFAFNIIRVSWQHALDFGQLFGVTKTEITEMYMKTVTIAIQKEGSQIVTFMSLCHQEGRFDCKQALK